MMAPPMGKSRLELMKTHLLKSNELHQTDLIKTQASFQDDLPENATILVLVKYPDFASINSCRYTTFLPGKVRLTLEQLEGTGSELLMGLLHDEKHQRRAKKAAAPLEAGVTHVLDLSPNYDEEDSTIALQRLTITEGIKLWYRSMAFGVSPLAVAAHDDVCYCNLSVHDQYPLPMPPDSAELMNVGREVCIFDTKEWPLDEHHKIDEFCQTRWAACTQRLFRSIAKPAGQKDLLIDSAPRMWTLVGLFSKLEMTNYDLLRDEVTAWFNADLNYLFVELCPEETLRVGLTLKIPLLSEPAFRILVNERALEVAGGQPRLQPTKTIFGRRCSPFTDDTESISRIVDHAGTAMADRYKAALDMVFSDDLLDRLDINEWEELRSLEEIIPSPSSTDSPLPVRAHYDNMMASVRAAVRQAIEETFHDGGMHLLDKISYTPLIGESWQGKSVYCLEAETVDAKRFYTVPKRELSGTGSFEMIWKHSLNQHQRALCPLFWQSFRNVTEACMAAKFFAPDVATVFVLQFARARIRGEVPPMSLGRVAANPSTYFHALFRRVEDALRALAARMVDRDAEAFAYTATPHLVLSLDDNEMNFLRLADDETRFQADVPEADLGPAGPGPAFHTGRSVAGAPSDLGLGRLSLAPRDDDNDDDDDGASTVVGSLVAQDGVSTVYDRRRVLAAASSCGPSSAASERFTDEDGMSAEYADAEYAVPAAHQSRGQTLADVVEEGESDDEDRVFEFSDDDDDDEEEEQEEEEQEEQEEEEDDFEVV